MNTYFFLLCILHVLIWLFIVLAFLNKTTAYYNLYYIIPAIYIIHILPFHVINKLKEDVYPVKEELENNMNNIHDGLVIPNVHSYFKDGVFKNSFANPLSPQGLLLFGAISSAWSLKNNCFFDI